MPSLYVGPIKQLLRSTTAPGAVKTKIIEKHAKMAKGELKMMAAKAKKEKNK